jgi:hypothetical protein
MSPHNQGNGYSITSRSCVCAVQELITTGRKLLQTIQDALDVASDHKVFVL